MITPKRKNKTPTIDPKRLAPGTPPLARKRMMWLRQQPPQQLSAPQQELRGRDSGIKFDSGSGSIGKSFLSKHSGPSAQLTHDEIKEIINEILGNISTDSKLEIEELLQALVNSGLKKNRETLKAAIEYVKKDIQAYVQEKQRTNKTNNDHQNNLEEMKMKIIGKINDHDSPAAANETNRGSFCCATGGSIKKKQNRKTSKKTKGKKEKKGRKWSKKYKDSINCKKPKGFSQRQHCLAKSKKRKTVKKN